MSSSVATGFKVINSDGIFYGIPDWFEYENVGYCFISLDGAMESMTEMQKTGDWSMYQVVEIPEEDE
ncbi:hypothetical protein CJ179_38585 [Rhodococcus sp. ACS1]|uniref:hypothetical protein n=1 Tax=Rhodococcus sp. ACS1 TaxID=2028570 RepID=UPI000BB0D426|nr:hypothetical protein [Rhodococcus sp. ACS1]PBC38508.1 hypothetical protein CJ179_38585 [Rhodococcus sp. ACS1]